MTPAAFCSIGALVIRIGFWDPLHYNCNKEPPQVISKAPIVRTLGMSGKSGASLGSLDGFVEQLEVFNRELSTVNLKTLSPARPSPISPKP